MNINFNPQSQSFFSYSNPAYKNNSKSSQGFIKNTTGSYSGLAGFSDDEKAVSDPATSKRRELIKQIRQLYMTSQAETNPYAKVSEDIPFWAKTSDDENEEDSLVESELNYNFKEVSSKIQSAKTSVSASQAVLAAKRKVMELKRKMASAGGDTEEIELALTHAKRMEIAARRKKNHLEMEEMVVANQNGKENQDKLKKAAEDMKLTLIDVERDKVVDKQAKLSKIQSEQLIEEAQKLREKNEIMSDRMIEEMSALLNKFGEEESRMLEEMSDMLDTMEIIDPHMSKEELKELKTKHRNAENKEILKADMDYLKGTYEHLSKLSETGGTSLGTGIDMSMPGIGISVSLVSPEMSGGTFDVQI